MESRWNGSGKVVLNGGETILYSGNPYINGTHEKGTAFILNKKASSCILGWEPVSDRIITVRVHSNFENVTVINVYAPTNEKPTEEKRDFYDELQAVIDKVPAKKGYNKTDGVSERKDWK